MQLAIACPVELIKIRLQTQSGSREINNFNLNKKNTWSKGSMRLSSPKITSSLFLLLLMSIFLVTFEAKGPVGPFHMTYLIVTSIVHKEQTVWS